MRGKVRSRRSEHIRRLYRAHPSALANLQKEVDEYFPTGEDCLSETAMEKHRGMVWLNAIVSVKVDVEFHD